MKVVGWIAVLLGLISAAAGVGFAVMLPVPVPRGDIVDFFRLFLEAGGFAGYGLGDLYERHNEHRLVIPRLWFLLDLALVDGRQTLLIATSVLSAVAHAVVLAMLFHRAVGGGRSAWVVFIVVLGMLLSPVQHENLLNGFQVQFVQVWLFATASLALLAVSPTGQVRPATQAVCVLGSVAFGLMATYTMVNGAAVWPLLVAFALWRRIWPPWVSMFFIVGAAVLASEVLGFEAHADHGDPWEQLQRPGDVLLFMARYLTSGIKVIGTLGQEIVGLACMASVTLAGAMALSRPGGLHPARMALFAVCAFVMAAAFATALGRLSFGIGIADISRYATPSMVFLAAVALLAFDSLRQVTATVVRASTTGLGVVFLLIPGLVQGVIEIPERLVDRDAARLAVVSHLAGGYRPETLQPLYPPWPPRASMVLDRMRADGLGPFSIEPAFRPPADVLELRTPAEIVCDGFLDRLRIDSVTGVEAAGWVLDRDSAQHPLWVLLRDADGDVVAWGGSLLQRDDLVAALPSGMHARAFLAFGPAPMSEGVDPVTVEGVFDDGRRCRLTASATPSAPRFIDGLPAAATSALAADWSVDPSSASWDSGAADAPDSALPVLGSVGQEGRQFLATAALRDPAGGTALAVPVRTGAYPFKTSVALIAADGQVLDSVVLDRPTAGAWRWLVLRGGPFADGMRLEIQVPTNHPGNGLAFGTPYWLSEG